MATVPFPPPPSATVPGAFEGPAWQNWFARISHKVSAVGQIFWNQLNFTGSNLTDIQTRNHNDLQNIQGGAAADYQHLTSLEKQQIYNNEVNTWFNM